MPRKGLDVGLVHVYTGSGKGKTTAALGLALRTCGHGLEAYVIQFMKSGRSGETSAAKKLQNLTVKSYGRDEFVDKNHPLEIDIKLAREALEQARKVVQGGHYDVVILDELIVALDYGLIDLGDVLDMILGKPPHVELILTGRKAPPEIIEVADLVTEMREVKHPHRRGVPARKGIEF